MERDCKNCIYANWKSEYDNGCTKWDCEYTPKDEVISVYEKYKRIIEGKDGTDR